MALPLFKNTVNVLMPACLESLVEVESSEEGVLPGRYTYWFLYENPPMLGRLELPIL